MDLDSSAEKSHVKLEISFSIQPLPYDPEQGKCAWQEYLAKLEKQSSVHQGNAQPIIGDITKLSKEFASNVATSKLEEFFGEQNFIIDAFICMVFVCIKDVAT